MITPLSVNLERQVTDCPWAPRCISELFLSLVKGLQAALAQLGKCPLHLETDNRSAATTIVDLNGNVAYYLRGPSGVVPQKADLVLKQLLGADAPAGKPRP